MVDERLQGVAQAGEFGDLLVEVVDVRAGQGLDLGAGALAVLPEGQQPADFFQREAQVTRAADEGQAMQVVLAVAAVTVVARPAGASRPVDS